MWYFTTRHNIIIIVVLQLQNGKNVYVMAWRFRHPAGTVLWVSLEEETANHRQQRQQRQQWRQWWFSTRRLRVDEKVVHPRR
jgi:hypothetical protein